MTRNLNVVCVLLLTLFFGCNRQPSGVDLSTPKKAAKSMLQAMYDNRPERVKACVLNEPYQHEVADAMTAMMYGMHKAMDAIFKRFGNEIKDLMQRDINPQQIDPSEVDAATETISGNTATLILPHGNQKVTLRKMRGGWQVDVLNFYKLEPKAEHVAVACPMLHAMAQAGEQVARDVEAGKYTSAVPAVLAMKQQMLAALKRETDRQTSQLRR